MSSIGEGQTHANRESSNAMYLKTGDPGLNGGGTYNGTDTEPSLQQYENIFGPAGRDVKQDQQRHKRHQRWHLPDALKGHNQYLTDRVDGLITDATNSPFTKNILPYVYLENPDQKIKWNVYSFDEGIASRVPYEAAARVLPQTKRSFSGYVVRHGLAIVMEHNFMVSAAGRENFSRQLTQLVGSIQMTNDLDVHVALLTAPSYQKHMNERYYDNSKTTVQICREYVDLFGIMQKIPNALDILIEDAKNHLKTWGSQPPTFCLCNGSLTTQLTMLPEKTNYITNGPDGAKRLANGPDLTSYRGLSIIPSRKFSMDAGTAPRDLLRRRVRVAEYYRIPWEQGVENQHFEFYDQGRDSMFRLSWKQLNDMAQMTENPDSMDDDQHGDDSMQHSSHWVTQSLQNSKPTSMENMGVHILDDIVQDNCCVLGVTNSTHKHQNNNNVLCLGPIGSKIDASRSNYKADLKDLYISNPYGLSKNLFNTMGPSYNLLKSMKNDEQMEMYTKSEMFGGGIFNDNVNSNHTIHSGFSGISTDVKNTMNKTNGMLFTNYIVAVMFNQLLRFDTSPNGLFAIQDSIREGNGMACVDLVEFHSIFSDDILLSEVKSQAVFSDIHARVQHMKDNISNDVYMHMTKDNQAFVSNYMDVMDGIDPTSINQILTSNEVGFVNVALRVYKYVHDCKMFNFTINDSIREIFDEMDEFKNYDIITYEVETSQLKIMKSVKFLGVFSKKALKDYYDLTDDTGKQTYYKDNVNPMSLLIRVACQYTGHVTLNSYDPYDLSLNIIIDQDRLLKLENKINKMQNLNIDKDFDNISRTSYMITLIDNFGCDYSTNHQLQLIMLKLAEIASSAFITYDTQIRSWASSIYESKMSKIDQRNGSKKFEEGNFFMSKHFQEIHQVMMLDCMANSLGNIEAEEVQQLYEWGHQNDGYRGESMFRKFKEDMHSGSNLAIQAINVTNANNNQCIHMPNLHISRCNPLQEIDMQTSFSSTNPSMWLIQQMAGIMPLTNIMCNSLMKIKSKNMSPDEEIQSIKLKSKYMMSPDNYKEVHTFDSETYKTFLMEEYQKNFNPEYQQTENSFPTTTEMKRAFITQMGEAIRGNEIWTQALESTIDLFHANKPHSANISTFCTATAAVDYNYIPSFVKRNLNTKLTSSSGDNECLNACFKRRIGWKDMPICHKFTACIYGDETRTCNDYVEQIMKEQGLGRQKLTRESGNFNQMQCTSNDVLLYDVRESNIVQMNQDTDVQSHLVLPWMRTRNNLDAMTGLGSSMYVISPDEHEETRNPKINNTNHIYAHTSQMQEFAQQAYLDCRDPEKLDEIWRHVILIWAARFWKPTTRFMDDGNGMITAMCEKSRYMHQPKVSSESHSDITSDTGSSNSTNKERKKHDIHFIQPGLPFMHGPTGAYLMSSSDNSSSGVSGTQYNTSAVKNDIFIIRPNIEHEMLGIIMGRGGTQELGATFWGQTELSCYDDAQHGIWGMSYKYHERAMVTNERNLIRVYDVAFDGYNGGMDQTFVDWNSAPSREKFVTQTYDRSTPYHGQSMLVMSLPHSEKESRMTWPNPIVFHQSVQGNPSPDAEKVHGSLPEIHDHMVFNHAKNPSLCSDAVQKRYEHYMNRLDMTQWASTDSLNRPAGEACIANESSSSPLAFQGSMRRISNIGVVTETHGSGHLGHSYVGMASVREGRGIQNTAMQPMMHRMI